MYYMFDFECLKLESMIAVKRLLEKTGNMKKKVFVNEKRTWLLGSRHH